MQKVRIYATDISLQHTYHAKVHLPMCQRCAISRPFIGWGPLGTCPDPKIGLSTHQVWTVCNVSVYPFDTHCAQLVSGPRWIATQGMFFVGPLSEWIHLKGMCHECSQPPLWIFFTLSKVKHKQIMIGRFQCSLGMT